MGDSQCNDSKVLQAVTDYLKECVGKLFELKSDEKLGLLFFNFCFSFVFLVLLHILMGE